MPAAKAQGIRDTTGGPETGSTQAICRPARLPRQTPRMAVIAGQRFSACVIRHFGAGLPKAFVPPLA